MLLGMIEPTSGKDKVLECRITDQAESLAMRRKVA